MDSEEFEARLVAATDEAARITTLTLAFFLNDNNHDEAASFLLRHAQSAMAPDEFSAAFKQAQRLRKAARQFADDEPSQ